MSFEPNKGQANLGVDYIARPYHYAVGLSSGGARVRSQSGDLMSLEWVGGNQKAAHGGRDKQQGVSHYVSPKWSGETEHFGRVRYTGVFPGIDVEYYGKEGELEYDLIVAPGADVKRARLRISGAEGLRVDGRTGDLVGKFGEREIRQRKPVAYQTIGGERRSVAASYRLVGEELRIEMGRYDRRYELTVDPVIAYYGALSGSGTDTPYGLALDADGNVVVVGSTASLNFNVQNALRGSNSGGTDAFIAKINSTGSSLLFATYYGGTGTDIARAVAIDGSGNIVVAGSTTSGDFPVQSAYRGTYLGGTEGFVLKLNSGGFAVQFATYFGGSGDDIIHAVATDAAGNIYIGGSTTSGASFPVASAFQSSNGGGTDGFVAKLDSSGSSLQYSTFLGGALTDEVRGIAVNSANEAYVVGTTASSGFPTQSPLRAYSALNDAFVTKLAAAGSTLVYSTLLGGSGDEAGLGITLDAAGAAVVVGSTSSIDFPVWAPYQTFRAGASDAFVTKLNPSGSSYIFSTYLGGSYSDEARCVGLDALGNIFVAGATNSGDFPDLNSTSSYGASGYVLKMDTYGTRVLYSDRPNSYSSGQVNGLAVGPRGAVTFVADVAYSYSSTWGAVDGGSRDAHVERVQLTYPVAGYLDNATKRVGLTFPDGSITMAPAGGAPFASDPAVAEDENGGVHVVVRDVYGSLWYTKYALLSATWEAWKGLGGIFKGTPAVAASNYNVYIAARDHYNAYWVAQSYISGSFTWANRLGRFSTDPVMRVGGYYTDGYLVGKDLFNTLWISPVAYPPYTWVKLGGVVAGNPALTLGKNGDAYVAARDFYGSYWMCRYNGNAANWYWGAGILQSDPVIAAEDGDIFVAGLANSVVWRNTFVQGTGNNWLGWSPTQGILASIGIAAATGPQVYLVGKDAYDGLWWHESPGAGWRFVGRPGLTAGGLAVAPR